MVILILKSLVLIPCITWTLSIILNANQGHKVPASLMWINGIAWAVFYLLNNL